MIISKGKPFNIGHKHLLQRTLPVCLECVRISDQVQQSFLQEATPSKIKLSQILSERLMKLVQPRFSQNQQLSIKKRKT